MARRRGGCGHSITRGENDGLGRLLGIGRSQLGVFLLQPLDFPFLFGDLRAQCFQLGHCGCRRHAQSQYQHAKPHARFHRDIHTLKFRFFIKKKSIPQHGIFFGRRC
jgi:hypothetical protein